MPPTTRPWRAAGALWALALLVPATSAAGLAQTGGDEPDLATFEQRLARAVALYEEAHAEVESLGARVATADLRVRTVARRMVEGQKAAVRVARVLYKGGSTVDLESMLSAETLADVQTRIKYLESSRAQQSSIFERLASDRAVLEARLNELDRARTRAQHLEIRMAEMKADLMIELSRRQERAAALEASLAAKIDRVVSAPPPPPAVPPPPAPTSRADWEAIAMCESGGRWHLDSTYDGGLQFHPDTWLAFGGGRYARYAWQATKAQQIAIAERVLEGQGPGAWPNCFKWKD